MNKTELVKAVAAGSGLTMADASTLPVTKPPSSCESDREFALPAAVRIPGFVFCGSWAVPRLRSGETMRFPPNPVW